MLRRLVIFGYGLVLNFGLAAASADIVVVVSAKNPVDALSRAELTEIFLGTRDRFPTGDPAVPVDQVEASPAYEQFYVDYLGRSPAQIKAHWSKLIFTGRGQPPRSVASGNAAVDFVAENPNAITYVDSALVDDRLRVVPIE